MKMKKTLLTLSLASILIGGVAMAGSEDPATSSGGHSVLYATGASLSAASTTLQQNGVFSFGFHTKKEAQKAARVLGLSDYAIKKRVIQITSLFWMPQRLIIIVRKPLMARGYVSKSLNH